MQQVRGNVLIVGDGDFSFTVAYASKLKGENGLTLVSSTLLSKEELFKLHKNAEENVHMLKSLDVRVMYELDATKLSSAISPSSSFDKIIFNFPHTGGKSNIKKNRQLLKEFFQSAREVMDMQGEVLVTLARGQGGTPMDEPIREWPDSWQVIGQAAYSGWIVSRIEPFSIENYPQYGSTGFRSVDRQFYTTDSKTYLFRRGHGYYVQDCGYGNEKLFAGKSCLQQISRKQQQRTENLAKHHPVAMVTTQLMKLVQLKFRALLPVSARVVAPTAIQNCTSGQYVVHLSHKEAVRKTRTDCRLTGEEMMKIQAEDKWQFWDEDSDEETDAASSTKSKSRFHHCYYCYPPGTTSGDKTGIRTTLFEIKKVRRVLINLAENEENRQICITHGDVYRRTVIDSQASPHILANEMLFAYPMMGGPMLEHWENFESNLLGSIKQILPAGGNLRKVSTTLEEMPRYYNPYMAGSRLEFTYVTKNAFSMSACNQVSATGKPDPNQAEALKDMEITRIVGYMGSINNSALIHDPHQVQYTRSIMCAMLDSDALALIRYDIPDYRLLWSENPAFLDQFKGLQPHSAWRFEPLSIHPPLWRHDLSFWEKENESVTETELMDIIHGVAGDAVSKVMLMNVYTDRHTALISKCYRIVYQSADRPLSHTDAHDLQSAIRLLVADRLGVKLR